MSEHATQDSTNDFLDDPEESVNLYELLGVTPDADAKRVRRRISELFLEAQNNVDHRSFRRRFYYRELQESLLPKARHLLLDDERRELYNQSLGLRIAPVTPPVPHIEYSKHDEESAPNAANASAKLASATPQNSHAAPEIPLSPIQETSAVAPRNVTSQRGITPDHLRMDADLVEQRRADKRRELIRHELVAEGQKWGIMAGFSSFAATAALFFGLALLAEISALQILAVPVALAAALFCARYAHRESRKRIITLLSQMPYDKLLQRCARL